MSEETKPAPDSGPFDVPTVKNLVELMKQFDINEIDLRDADRRILLRRGISHGVAAVAPTVSYQAVAQPSAPAATPTSGSPASSAAPAASSKPYLEIKSPMVGTFYAKPAPDKDDYVKVGSRVSADTIVCKIEAMKIFNDLPAGVSGTLVEVVAQNGQFVEFEQVLFRVDPTS